MATCLLRASREGDWNVTSHARPQREPGLEPAASFRRWLGPSCRADPQHPEDATGCPGSCPRSPHWPERHSGPGRVPAAFTGSPSPSPAGVSADPLTRWAQSCLVERPEVAWCGLAWCGLAWPGVAWPGVAWRGLVWRGLAWPGVACRAAGSAAVAATDPGQAGRGAAALPRDMQHSVLLCRTLRRRLGPSGAPGELWPCGLRRGLRALGPSDAQGGRRFNPDAACLGEGRARVRHVPWGRRVR